MVKTVQLGLRIDTDLLARIEFMAKHEGIDKMSWIRRALAAFLNGEEEERRKEAIENFIHLQIDEEELMKILNKKTVAKDIIQARKDTLQVIKQRDE